MSKDSSKKNNKYEQFYIEIDSLSSDEKIILEWFDFHYLEEKSRIFELLKETSKNHACNFGSLYRACVKMKRFDSKRTSLSFHVKYFGKMADAGISGFRAGVALLHYFQVSSVIDKK